MNSVLYFLLFLIQPFWSSVLFLFSAAKRRPTKFQIILLIFSISILGIYWYPWGDAQVHFGIYYCDIIEIYANSGMSKIISFYDIIIREIAQLCGNYMWGYFFWIFFPWSIYAILIWNKVEQDSIKPYTLIIWILILVIGIRELLDLNRNISSFLFYTSSLLIYNKNKLLSILLLIFALLLHTSCLGLLLISLLCFCFLRTYRLKTIISLFVLAILIGLILPSIMGMFVSAEFMDMYITGAFGAGHGVDSGFFYLMTIINILMSIIIGYMIFKCYNKIKKNFLFASYLGSCFFILFFWLLWTMRERFLIINILLGFAVMIFNWKYIGDAKALFKRILYGLISLSCIKIMLVIGVEYSSEIIHRTGSYNPEQTLITVLAPTYLPTFYLMDIEEYGFNDNRLKNDFPIVHQFVTSQK